MVASCVFPTGDLACNPGVYPDWESNQQPFGSQKILSPPPPNFRLVEENICATSFLDLVSLGYLVYVLMVLLILFFTVFVWHLSFHLVICPENLVILASENIFSGLHHLKGILTRGLCSFNLCC